VRVHTTQEWESCADANNVSSTPMLLQYGSLFCSPSSGLTALTDKHLDCSYTTDSVPN